MTDLTVLISPIPLYPNKNDFAFGRPKQPLSRPIMVTLETEVETHEVEAQEADNDSECHFYPQSRASENIRIDPGLLSPPINTWKSRSPPRPSYRYQHRPTRSQSAPPDRRAPTQEENEQNVKRNSVESLQDTLPDRRSIPAFRNNFGLGPGELVRPPPPLFRPTTFWRKTRRSGVTSASYSPSSHLIRRSTYIAAGLEFDRPVHDLSALCVESRVARVDSSTSRKIVMTRFPMAMVFFLLPFFSSGSKADILQSPPQNLVHATFMIVSALPAFSNPTLSSFTLGTTSRPPPSQASAVFTKRQQGGGILSLSFAIPAPAPTPSPNLIPNGAVIPLLLSPYPSTSTSSSRFSTSVPVSATSASITPTSSKAGSTTSNTQHVHITPSTFLPFIGLVSFFVLALMGWCLHGWCTRKPKEKFRVKMTKDGDGEKPRGRVLRKGSRKGRGAGEAELICGPEYASLTDVERGHESERCDYPGLGQDPYRWPSLSMSVPVHEVMTPKEQRGVGRYARPTRSESQSQHLNLGRKPTASSRSTHERVQTHSKSSRRHPPASTTAVANSSSSPASPTSVALKELYDGVLMALSVSEAAPEVDRDARTPLAGVGGAFSTGLGSGDKLETNGASGSGRKRRAYERRDSEMDEVRDVVDVSITSDSKRDWEDSTGRKLAVRNPSLGEGRLGQIGDEDGYDYTPLPTPTRLVHEEREPLFSQIQLQRQTHVSKDILPAHPNQITSPPLESQICFVPIGAAGARVIGGMKRQKGIAHS